MMNNNLKKTIKNILFYYLSPHNNKAFIFGSFAEGTIFRGSDIDIGIKSKDGINAVTLIELKSAFEDSDIPYAIDVVDFHNVPLRFQKYALKKIIPLN